MGIQFAIDRRVRLVIYLVDGDATQAEARAFFDAVLAHPEYRCGFDFLGDRRGACATPDPGYVFAVSAEVLTRASVLGSCRWAVVVADDAAHDRAQTWAAMVAPSGVLIHPFRTAEEAADWLGLPADYDPFARLSANPIPRAAPVAETCGGQDPTLADVPIAPVAPTGPTE
jgi:hypothetical protein